MSYATTTDQNKRSRIAQDRLSQADPPYITSCLKKRFFLLYVAFCIDCDSIKSAGQKEPRKES